MTAFQFIAQSPVTFIVCGLVLVAAVIGVIYGVYTQYDRGFIEKGGKRLRWYLEDLPLVVAYTGTVPLAYLEELISAITTINNEITPPSNGRHALTINVLGTALLRWDSEIGSGSSAVDNVSGSKVNILVDMLPEGTAIGGTTDLRWNNTTGQLLACHVRLAFNLEGEQRITTIAHELGHCLGLAHDDKRTSTMHGHAGKRSKVWTRRDIRRLRREYA